MVMYTASLLADDYAEDGTIDGDALAGLVDNMAESGESGVGDFYGAETYEILTAYFGAATAYYLSGEASSDFTSQYETALEALTSDSVSRSAAAGYLIGLCSSFASEIDEDSTYYTSGALYKDTAAFLSLMSVLTESYDSGSFDFDFSDMSWNDGSSTDVLSCLEALLVRLSSSSGAAARTSASSGEPFSARGRNPGPCSRTGSRNHTEKTACSRRTGSCRPFRLL